MLWHQHLNRWMLLIIAHLGLLRVLGTELTTVFYIKMWVGLRCPWDENNMLSCLSIKHFWMYLLIDLLIYHPSSILEVEFLKPGLKQGLHLRPIRFPQSWVWLPFPVTLLASGIACRLNLNFRLLSPLLILNIYWSIFIFVLLVTVSGNASYCAVCRITCV